MSERTSELLVRAVRLEGQGDGLWDVHIRGGVIREVSPTGAAPALRDVLDAYGALALPGLRDAHCHVDNSFVGLPWQPHVATGSLAERIARDYELRGRYGMPGVAAITPLLEQMIAHGTSAVRTHTKIDTDRGLAGVDAVAAAAAQFAGRLDVEQVAFPQSGIIRDPGVEGLLERAIESGVAVVGGIDPAGVDGDPVAHLNVVFGMAARHGCDIDIHLHDRGELGAWQIGLICDRARAGQIPGEVTISHALALGDVDGADRSRLVDNIAAAGVRVVTCIVGDQQPPPLRDLLSAGVRVGLGNDSIRNSWSPFGTGDMLERAWLLAMRTGMSTDDELATVYRIASHSDNDPAGLAGPLSLGEGDEANFYLVPAENVCDAVTRRPPRQAVIHDGTVVWQRGRPEP